jgi:8-hydroxy-5-deazaflavin:NADPH oxidoreductase
MKYAIIGAGKIGTALARAFARKSIAVGLANTRGPQTIEGVAKELGPSVSAQSAKDGHEAEISFLAVPFPAHKEVAMQLANWGGKIVVDVTNTLDLTPAQREQFGGAPSSEVVARAFVGARLVKGFNHLPANQLGTVAPKGQRQVMFLSSNDQEASSTIAALATQLGFAPVVLGRLGQGGAAIHVLGGTPGELLFQNPLKLG